MSVSEWGGDSGARVPGADVIASEPAAVNPKESANRSGNDGSGDLGASSAAERVATWLAEFNTLGGLDNQVAHIANRTPLYVDDLWALVRAVRVSEDDTTVDRVARALCGGATYDGVTDWDIVTEGERRRFRSLARAAVRALREAGQ